MNEDEPQDEMPEEGIMGEASIWFGRMQGPEADTHRPNFEAWLARGALHRAFYNRAGEIYALGKFLKHDAEDEGEESPEDDGHPAPHVGGRNRFWLLSTIAATMCLLVAALAIVIPKSLPNRRYEPVIADQRADKLDSLTLETKIGQILSQTLADGSRVTLEANSSLRVAYDDGSRTLTLQKGKARFEVAHEKRPFIVCAGKGSVTARGTIFEVTLLSANRVTVHLVRGSIDVALNAHDRRSRDVRRLVAGDVISFAADGSGQASAQSGLGRPAAPPVVPAAPLAPGEASEWREFDNTPLGEVVRLANGRGGAQIRLGSPDLADLKVSGRFRLDDPARLAQKLGTIFDLVVERKEGSDLVLRRR